MMASIEGSDRIAGSSKTATDNSASNREDLVNSRRYMDVINAAGRALNLDRRGMYGERRIDLVARYNGPARRRIIDRRGNPGDRRG